MFTKNGEPGSFCVYTWSLKTLAGSTVVARLAGSHAATDAAPANRASTARYVRMPSGIDPGESSHEATVWADVAVLRDGVRRKRQRDSGCAVLDGGGTAGRSFSDGPVHGEDGWHG